jgi:hypothetical protein
MRTFQVKPFEYDLTPTAGLALVGHQLKTLAPVLADVDAALPVRTGVATSDIVRSYVGLLARLDSGLDSAALMACIESMNVTELPQTDWTIKWNPRSTDAAERAAAGASWEHPRPGKRVVIWEQAVEVTGVSRPVHRVLRLVEPTIGSQGQHLILPEYELDGWTTSLPERIDARQVIALYADHGTHVQFHAEFKTDLDLERLPSGKFETNALVCHAAKRRRIKTVMQELIDRAGRLIAHGRPIVLGLGANDRSAAVFMRLHAQFAATA